MPTGNRTQPITATAPNRGSGPGTLPRRRFLATGIGLTTAIASSTRALAAPVRSLSFQNLHTDERLSTVYWANGAHLPGACHQIDWILRDHRSGDVATMSTRLLDLLFQLRTQLGPDAAFEVISGYRSPRTNAALARSSDGVAARSLHTRGLAIDIRVRDCSVARLRDEALKLKLGGVGYYPKSGFVHVDVGPVRFW